MTFYRTISVVFYNNHTLLGTVSYMQSCRNCSVVKTYHTRINRIRAAMYTT